jgi:voltage-gated potassium channel
MCEPTFRKRLSQIVFEAETPAAKAYDLVLLATILLSVGAVMLESVESVRTTWGAELRAAEWAFTVLFTAEYLLRVWLSDKPLHYMRSFFGIIDLLSCLPNYLAVFVDAAPGFSVVRILRLLRMFRILKMVNHLRGARVLLVGLRLSLPKVTVFFCSVLVLSILAGTLLYFVESGSPHTRLTSIPIAIYYAIVSVTTVGYGDIVVTTDAGRFITAALILTGYAIIAVPTGIVAADMARAEKAEGTRACPACGAQGHGAEALHCSHCGQRL